MLIDLLLLLGVLVAALVSALLLGLALFADRTDDKRCCKCWFCMEHAASLRCPECGYEAKDETAFHKTRRHWKWVMASLLPLLLSAYFVLQLKANRDGWESVMPTTALILLVRIGEREFAINALDERILRPISTPRRPAPDLDQRMWKWQWRLLGHSMLKRLDQETRPDLRVNAHHWLEMCSRFAQSQPLQYAALVAHGRDFGHADYEVRMSAVRHVIRPFDNEDFQDDVMIWVKSMLPLLDHDDEYVRRNATLAMILAVKHDARAIPSVIAATRHHHADVRARSLAAIRVAAEHHDFVPNAYEAVLALENDQDDEVRYWRVIALASLQSSADAWHTIEAALQSTDPSVRRGGLASTYERSGWTEAAVVLTLDCFDDPDELVQLTAETAWWVSMDEIVQHAEMLRGFLNHESEVIRRQVGYLLSKLDDE